MWKKAKKAGDEIIVKTVIRTRVTGIPGGSGHVTPFTGYLRLNFPAFMMFRHLRLTLTLKFDGFQTIGVLIVRPFEFVVSL